MDRRKVFAKYLTKDMYLQHTKNPYKAVKRQPNLKKQEKIWADTSPEMVYRWWINMTRCLLSSEKLKTFIWMFLAALFVIAKN